MKRLTDDGGNNSASLNLGINVAIATKTLLWTYCHLEENKVC